ncbi:porin [Tabrizicola oligotrophica]|uniref:Porin n=1 Tax=Tabrizicola oligotrophica TaxID=2710650 RepID=A0A6M0QT19_9RHOB|nr:porin [Tabrizicola oligotrophica]NEY89582.1 porin [Tabrizicola oligotrophica]
MKKVLLATTAVVLSAGVASAEVALSGNARMGLQYDSISGDTVLEKRMTVNIDATTESSSGITFGARLRLRSNEAGAGTVNGARVYMSTNGLEIAAGNIYGALDSMPGMYDSEVGLTALNDAGVVTNTVANPATAWGFDGYSSSGNGAEGIEAIYTAGGFTGHLSYSEPTLSSGASAQKRTAVYGAYVFNDWTVALGLQDSSVAAEDKVVLTVGGKIGDFGVGFAAADNDGESKVALNGSATFGATTVNGFIADEESGAELAIGLGVTYDLGGASVMAGVERDAVGDTRADLGVSFSF